jgi:RHS repeat-associated protein
VDNQNYTQSFTYDASGNMLSQKLNEKTIIYDYKGNINRVGSDYANPDAVTETVITGATPTVVFQKTVVEEPLPNIIPESPVVAVSPLAPIISSFISDTNNITKGQSVTLSWTLAGRPATTLSINNSVGSVLKTNSKKVTPKVTTTYTLTAKNRNGTTTKSIEIIVNQPVVSEVAIDPSVLVSRIYQYDENGNVISDGTNTYTYDYNNRLVSAVVLNSAESTKVNYAYDITGQRIKYQTIGENSDTTYYPSMYYNSSDTTITKHIFANGIMLATITGIGPDDKVTTTLTDHLLGSGVVLDSANKIVETTDYYPFGEIRFDNKTSSFSEQRKYIGQEFDVDTGLNYLNARYYNSSIGRFISQDPLFWTTSAEWLQDPQNQNAYSYARNNPITFSDPSGEKVWIESKPVFDIKGHTVGIHTYLKAVPDRPNEINIQGLPQGAEGFTMGGYNSSNNGITNKLIKNMGTTETSWDKDTAFGDGFKINSMEIKPPEGQSDTQFINNLGKIYNETDLSGMNYYYHGTVNLPGGFNLHDGNCNNFSYTMGVRAGVKDQMDSFNPNSNVSPLIGAYGYRNELPTQTLSQQIQGRIDSIKEKINNYISSLTNKNK